MTGRSAEWTVTQIPKYLLYIVGYFFSLSFLLYFLLLFFPLILLYRTLKPKVDVLPVITSGME